MIPLIIHQVYGVFDDGRPLSDIPVYFNQVQKTINYCTKNNISYKMWNSTMCNDLVNKYPQYRGLYDNFKHKIMKADFIRYLILYDEGGLYVDCDICPIGDLSDLFKNDEFFVYWSNDKNKKPYNAVLGSLPSSPLYVDILEHLETSYYEKLKNPTYERWIGRFVFQTTGHHMLQRVLKNHPYVKRLDILKINAKGGEIISDKCPLFEDFNASIWYNNGNQMYS